MQNPNEKRDKFVRLYDRIQNSEDGSKEAGMVFIVAFFAGLILAEQVFPNSLAFIGTWFVVLLVAALITGPAKEYFDYVFNGRN